MTTSTALAISMAKVWYTFPQIVRFGISGTLGNVVFFIMDQNFYKHVMLKYAVDLPKIVNRNAEAVSFFISYLGQIVVQHSMNAALVFGLESIRGGNYFKSLLKCYTAYASTLVVSTFFNAFLLQRGVSRNIAFWVTLYGFGVVNFILLKNVTDTSKEKNHQSEHGNSALQPIRGGAFDNGHWQDEVSIVTDLMNLHSRSIKHNKAQDVSILV